MERLLSLLDKLDASSVYFLASKQTLTYAFRRYENNGVNEIQWNKDKTTLSLDVLGFPSVNVQICEKDGALTYKCDCDFNHAYHSCDHIICSIITIKNLLNPNLYKLKNKSISKKRDYLYSRLFEENPIEDSPAINYAVEFEYNRNYPCGYITINAQKYDHRYGLPADAPPEIRQFLKINYNSMETFYHVFRQKDYKVSLNLRHHDKVIPISFDDGRIYKPCVEFGYTGGKVFFKLLCSLDPDEAKSLLVMGDFIVNTATNMITPISDTKGLNYWKQLKNTFDKKRWNPHQKRSDIFSGSDVISDNIVEIPMQTFQNSVFRFSALNQDTLVYDSLLFTINGGFVDLKTTPPPKYRISADEDKAGYSLTASGVTEGSTFTPAIHPFEFFYVYMPAGLNSQKKRNIIYQTFIALFSEKTKKEKTDLIKKMISEETFGKHKYVREARKLLKSYIEMNFENLQLIFQNNQWAVVPIDIRNQLPLFSVPYELFGLKIFESIAEPGNMWVEKQDFTPKVPELLQALMEKGVELLINNQAVLLTSWDFEVNVTKKAIDWFEIKQEIRYHGNLITKQMLKEALSGVVRHGGAIHFLDETTLKNLTKLSKLLKEDSRKEIVTIPRLQIFDLLSLRKTNIKVTLPKEEEEIIKRLLSFESIAPKNVPAKLKAKLRQYQKDGFSWLSFLYEHRFGACLADDMGLGKTVQAIALLAAVKEGIIATGSSSAVNLVIVPPTLLFNWESELERFYPDLKIYLYRGKDRDTNFEGFDIVLTSYALIRRDIEKLSALRFNIIVFDEAQMIKNIYADTTGAVRKLNAYFKLGLTGTPLENHIGEYYSIMDLLLPGLLGQYRQYRGTIANDAMESLIFATRPFVLRRTKDKILKELPPKVESDVYLSLTESQKALYNKTVENVKKTVTEAYENKPESQAKIIALTALLRLRQVCLSSRLLLPVQKEKSPKIEFLVDKTTELMEEGHSCLVFSQFTAFLDLIEARLKELDCKLFRLDGETTVIKRKKIVEDFQNSETPSIFLLSLKAGGQGLNLTRATYVFHMDPWWNPAVENQASDRAHRIGQKNKVIITRLIMQHTVEEKIMHLKKRKSDIYNAIMDPATVSDKVVLSKKDFEYILNVTV
ncbi:DEAD/DEAH box helicase [Candidatus Magnetomonas plexicatena]|uniref:DEAD/DEAH box helicase n=1 Tax=Candidatus Magnetomonas plexicatena TaxID=2552947 RepID=UPI001C7829B3|nr:DEAD/DEAH box helicase [Nitrospirales bacterium LBB_01]